MDQGSSPLGSNPPRQGPPDNLPRPSDASASQKSEGIDLRFPDSTVAQSLPKPPTPSSPSMPVPPSPASTTKGPATTSVPTEYKTSIRTMAEDISKVKVGQKPSGVEIQKTIPAMPRPITPTAPQSQPSAPVPPSAQASLGQTERSRPLAPSAPMPRATAPVVPSAPVSSLGQSERSRPLAPSAPMPRPAVPVRPFPQPQATMPEVYRPVPASRGVLYMAIAGILIAGGVLYFILRGGNEVAQTPSPTAVVVSRTPTPSPTPDISSFISGATDTITLATSGNVTADFLAKISALAINPGEIRKVLVSDETKGSGDFGMIDLLERLLLPYPTALNTAIGPDSLILVFGQRESFTATGQPNLSASTQKRIIFLSEVKDTALMAQIMQTWETTIADSFAPIFSLTKSKASGIGFSSNTYSNANIRYRNFAYPDKAIDYSLVSAPNGKLYLIVAGSRESAFAAIDALR